MLRKKRRVRTHCNLHICIENTYQLYTGGLIIVHASYGKLSVEQSTMNNDDEKNPYVVDVTMPVQFFVENSQLHLPPTTKSGLAGFYDPCPGEEKFLEVIYLFKNKLHRVVVADTQPLRAPLQGSAFFIFICIWF